MGSVTAEIRKILKDKEKGITSGTKAIRKLLEELRKDVLFGIHFAATDSWDAYHLPGMLETIEAQIANFTKKASAEASGLLEKSWGKGQMLVDVPLEVSGIYFGYPGLATSTLDTLRDFTVGKISNVSQVAFDKIKGELTMGILGGKTPQDVIKGVGKNLRDPSIFKSIALRAETITKTEMGRAFSMATEMRMEQAGEYVTGLEKQWVHAGHPKKPRMSHFAAHGQHVPVNEPFMIGGRKMMHPRDPGAPIEEIIHCGCDHVPYHDDWGVKIEDVAPWSVPLK